MTNEEILQKAIEKARANGMILTKDMFDQYGRMIIFSHDFAKAFWGEEDKRVEKYANIVEGFIDDYLSVEDWNKSPRNTDSSYDYWIPVYEWKNKGWQYHLQQMVLEEEPLKYLEKYL